MVSQEAGLRRGLFDMMTDAFNLDPDVELASDICIVGAGAAGISLALKLIDSDIQVIVLEAGGEGAEDATQALYRGRVRDERLHAPPDRYRQRQFGGSTALWGGRCTPLDEIDFTVRPWMSTSGWPIGLDDLVPYYEEANRLCEAGAFAYTAEAAFPNGMRPMLRRFRGSEITDNTLERFSRPTNFARRYHRRLEISKNVNVILHANATELLCNDDGSVVTALQVKTLRNQTFKVRAGYVVIATGGLEVPRLLLASRGRHMAGIGNEYDQVGRYYMCHLAGTIGDVQLDGNADDVWNGYDVSEEGVYCRRRFALKASAQRRLGIGNFVARLHHPSLPDPAHRTGALSAIYLAKPLISYEYRKRLDDGGAHSIGEWIAHLRNLAADPFDTMNFMLHILRDRKLASRKFPSVIIRPKSNRYSLDFHVEQEPNPTSRIQLAGERDALGMQRIIVDWRYSAFDIDTVRQAVRLLADELRTCGAGTVSYSPNMIEWCAIRYGAYGGHHIGTARMSPTPRTGVVDANCKVHGIRNLFLAGSAVFSTSGQANPTLTIVALSLRLASLLKAELRRTSSKTDEPTANSQHGVEARKAGIPNN
jgi:choline dehydrogenase-like flavoprotein